MPRISSFALYFLEESCDDWLWLFFLLLRVIDFSRWILEWRIVGSGEMNISPLELNSNHWKTIVGILRFCIGFIFPSDPRCWVIWLVLEILSLLCSTSLFGIFVFLQMKAFSRVSCHYSVVLVWFWPHLSLTCSNENVWDPYGGQPGDYLGSSKIYDACRGLFLLLLQWLGIMKQLIFTWEPSRAMIVCFYCMFRLLVSVFSVR